MMKAILLFSILASFALESSATLTAGCKMKFGVPYLTESFYSVHKTNTSASEDGWVKENHTCRHSGYEVLEQWCPSADKTTCIWFDDTGYIAGIQFAISVDNCSTEFDMETLGFETWTTTIDSADVKYYCMSQYFVSADYLATDVSTRSDSRSGDFTLLQDDAWFDWNQGELMQVSSNITDIVAETTSWTKQNCVIFMGTHYYYNMSTSTECTSTGLAPWFLLIHNNQLVGSGFMLFAKVVSGLTYENPGETAVKYIVPNGPDCLYTIAETSIMTMHTYYIEHPLADMLTC